MTYSHMELARAFLKTGELADALDALDAHLREQPGDAEARRLRIAARLRGRDATQWQALREDFAALDAPTPEDYLYLAAACEKLNDPEALLAALHQGLEQHPEHERLTERLVETLAAQGDGAAALALLEDLPYTWRWRGWAGDLHAQRGEYDSALACFNEAIALLDTQRESMAESWAAPLLARLLLARAESLLAMGCLDEAAADYQSAQALVPDDPMIAFNLGLLALLQGDEAAGMNACTAAYRSAGAGLQAHMRAALEGDPRYAALLERLSNA